MENFRRRWDAVGLRGCLGKIGGWVGENLWKLHINAVVCSENFVRREHSRSRSCESTLCENYSWGCKYFLFSNDEWVIGINWQILKYKNFVIQKLIQFNLYDTSRRPLSNTFHRHSTETRLSETKNNIFRQKRPLICVRVSTFETNLIKVFVCRHSEAAWQKTGPHKSHMSPYQNSW